MHKAIARRAIRDVKRLEKEADDCEGKDRINGFYVDAQTKKKYARKSELPKGHPHYFVKV